MSIWLSIVCRLLTPSYFVWDLVESDFESCAKLEWLFWGGKKLIGSQNNNELPKSLRLSSSTQTIFREFYFLSFTLNNTNKNLNFQSLLPTKCSKTKAGPYTLHFSDSSFYLFFIKGFFQLSVQWRKVHWLRCRMQYPL